MPMYGLQRIHACLWLTADINPVWLYGALVSLYQFNSCTSSMFNIMIKDYSDLKLLSDLVLFDFHSIIGHFA